MSTFPDRRTFNKSILAGVGAAVTGQAIAKEKKSDCGKEMAQLNYPVDQALSEKMYKAALAISKGKVRGGDSEPYFKKPFMDAAFSENIFLWDTCFICCYAKYHLDELPVYQALDNFYQQMDDDGFISREYRKDGTSLWPKAHPVSINPPLLAFAERQLFEESGDVSRLRDVYPKLQKNFTFLVREYMNSDGLFRGDALGSGMDNIPRYPQHWVPEKGSGLEHDEMLAKVDARFERDSPKWVEMFAKEYLVSKQGVWHEHASLVDISSQMALFAKDLIAIARLVDEEADVVGYQRIYQKIADAVNSLCWDQKTQFYYDLGDGKPVPRKHIGMYWALLAGIVPKSRQQGFISHLMDERGFYRPVPLNALSADDPAYVGWGDYWLGGVWAPTVYMVLKGLSESGEHTMAQHLARKVYSAVAAVYVATDTFWENYAPELAAYGLPSKQNYCGWSAIFPMTVYREFIQS